MRYVEVQQYTTEPWEVSGTIYSADLTDIELSKLGYTRALAPIGIEFHGEVEVTKGYGGEVPKVTLWNGTKYIVLNESRWDGHFFTEILNDMYYDQYAEACDDDYYDWTDICDE